MSIRLADNREAWLEARRKCISATDAAAILGLNTFSSPLLVWKDKLGLMPEKDQTDAMKLGIDLEAWIAGIWNRDHNHGYGEMVQGDFVTHPSEPYFGCTPDYLVGDDAVLECKYAGINAARAFGEEYSDEVPDHYFLQVQWQLFVTGRKMGYLAVFAPTLGSSVRVYEIPRNDAIIDTAAAQCRRFWNEHVVKEIPPEVTGSRADTQHINGQFEPPADFTSVRATEEIEEAVTALKAATSAAKAAATEVDRLKNVIKQFMNDQKADGLMTDHGTFKLANQTRTTFNRKGVVQLCKDNNLDPALAETYASVSTSPRLTTPFEREG